mmetsp:Transcript_9801/g.13414  ORF Transcript_9801/g.13414 Transcript_9801/m.13414 type:complete len:227 (-) Transcript_9801:37-717(-)
MINILSSGNNDRLQLIEIPCIAFDIGPDIDKLSTQMGLNDLIIITSPQAAGVFIDSWSSIGKPPVKIVSVGKGTSKPLEAVGLIPVFEPSDATGETLAEELPESLGKTILYPSSSLADNKLTDILTSRGFQVTRINTYCTVPATWSEEQLAIAKTIDIVTFASPSAIKIWTERVGNQTPAVVVIGPTSKTAAEKAGYVNVYCPASGSKGIEPWAALVNEVALKIRT